MLEHITVLAFGSAVQMQGHFTYNVKAGANAITMVHQPSETLKDVLL